MFISKRKIPYIAAVAVVAIIIIMGIGLTGFQMGEDNGEIEPIFLEAVVETLDARCISGDLKDMEVRRVSTTIEIEVPIETPTPCYSASGTAILRGDDIEVNIETDSRPGFCVQCVGSITAKVTLRNIPAGQYNLIVNTPSGTSTARV